MNKILIITILLILVIYYLNQVKQSQEHPKTIPESFQPALKSTQTDLTSKQISLLTNQWNQVALWAQEQGIDTNQPWNLTSLKKKLEKDLKEAQQPSEAKYQQLLKFSQSFLKEMGYSSYQELEKGVKELKQRNKALEKASEPTPKLTSQKSTQTDNLPSNPDQEALERSPEDFDKSLEQTLTNLIASMQKLNQEIK